MKQRTSLNKLLCLKIGQIQAFHALQTITGGLAKTLKITENAALFQARLSTKVVSVLSQRW